MHVSDLYHACPVPVKRPNSLHVPVLSHETCMVHPHTIGQGYMHEMMWDLSAWNVLKHARDLHVSGAPFRVGIVTTVHSQLVVCVNQSHHILKLIRQWEFAIFALGGRSFVPQAFPPPPQMPGYEATSFQGSLSLILELCPHEYYAQKMKERKSLVQNRTHP